MNPIFCFLLFIILFISCNTNEKVRKITFVNNSRLNIDSVIVTTKGVNLKLNNFISRVEKTVSYSIEKNDFTEQIFVAKIFVKDSLVSIQQFGYFDNIGMLPSEMKISIEKNLKLKTL